MKEKPDFGFLEKLEIQKKKSRSISANCKQKRDLNLKKVLETLTQRDIRSAAPIGYFILDFYFFSTKLRKSFSNQVIIDRFIKYKQEISILMSPGWHLFYEALKFWLQLALRFWKKLTSRQNLHKPNLDESWVGFGSPSSEYSTSNPTSQIPFPKIISNKNPTNNGNGNGVIVIRELSI